jgi:thiopeptide-type bacteriocin biosynthesis protein
VTPLFRPLAHFLVRAPTLPLTAFPILTRPGEFPPDQPWNSFVQESVTIASPVFVDTQRRVREGAPSDGRRRERAARTTLRYASRMTSRATPFGLFAGVAVGTFGTCAEACLGPVTTWRTRSRPDMGWLLHLVKTLERWPGVLDCLRVVPTSMALRVGPRLVLPFTSAWTTPETAEFARSNVSIRATPPVLRALELASSGPTVAELTAALLAETPQAGEQRLRRLIEDLVENEFLLTELVPACSEPRPLDHVVAVLDGVSAAAEEWRALVDLRSSLDTYDERPPGPRIPQLTSIRERASAMRRSDQLLMVDLAFPRARVTLPPSVGEEVARAAECLWRLSPASTGLPHLRTYHAAFLERYGVGRAVPVLELISDDTGLGPPEPYRYPPGERNWLQPATRDTDTDTGSAALVERALAALLQGRREFELTDALLDELAPAGDRSTAPTSLEIFAEVVAKSTRDLDAGQYLIVLSPLTASYGAGKASGRFLDLLPGQLVEQLARHYRREEADRPSTIFAELTHLPPHGRLANVTLVPCLRRFEVPVGTRPTGGGVEAISLDDIVVYSSGQQLHLSVRSRRCELVVTAAQMVNADVLPNIYRFLLELSFEGVRLITPAGVGLSSRLARFPRIRYRHTVLAPETWNIRLSDVAESADETRGSWHNRFRAWCASLSVPRHVQLVMNDQRLLLDLSEDSHADQVRREILQRGRACMHEFVGGLEERALTGPWGRHTLEGVFSLERNGLGRQRAHPAPSFPQPPVEPADRLRLPGSDWLYLKIYTSRRRQDEAISEHLCSFAQAATEQQLCASWFYIRYTDPAPHLRVRFNGDPCRLMELLARTEPWAHSLHHQGLLLDLQVATYDREVERYGDTTLMPLAEELFAADSLLCARLLSLVRRGVLELPKTSLAAVTIVDLLDHSGVPNLQSGWTNNSQLAAGQLTPALKELAGTLWLPDGVFVPTGTAGAGWARAIALLIAGRADPLSRYRRAIEGGPHHVRLNDIVGSVVHMHCNRLMGAQEDERRAIAVARQLHHWRAAVRERATTCAVAP